MNNDTVTLLLGITFGFAVVGLVIGLTYLMSKAQAPPTVVLSGTSNGYATYKNEEKWSVIKDQDGRVRQIVVNRHATSE